MDQRDEMISNNTIKILNFSSHTAGQSLPRESNSSVSYNTGSVQFKNGNLGNKRLNVVRARLYDVADITSE